MLFEIPHKPDDMPLEIWTALLRRAQNACEIKCDQPCDRRLEVDHLHAQALGGETSLANCRLVCARFNRERGMQPDPKWRRPTWFDERPNFENLRRMQMACGPDAVLNCAELFTTKRRELLRYVSLLAMVTGAGKTLTMVALLLAINEEVNRQIEHAPRVRKVLWFVQERALGDQLKRELLKEIVDLGIHASPPSVQICNETGDLERGPMHHDFTISCPHALWERKDQKRSDAEIAETLSKWDVIVWDECDFAADQIGRLARLAPHALKFGLTATPIDGSGEFLRHFALAGKASYRAVFDHDRCLSLLVDWQEARDHGWVMAVPHSAYCTLDAGIEVHREGQHGVKSSLPGGLAAIRHAIVQASEIEREMRKAMPEHWYSPHILIRCDSKAEAKHLKAQVDRDLEAGMFDTVGEGWRTTIIHQGMRGVPAEESRLFHDQKGVVHPFLRAKDHRGRCDRRSSRILFCVDMGLRGLNNWPTLIVVDIARGNSVNVQVQILGRPMRLPFWLQDAARDKKLREFVAIRYFYPDHGGSPGAMQQAFDFVLDMDARFESAGLIGWADILDGEDTALWHLPQATEQPFTLGDRVQVDAELGRVFESGTPIEKIDSEVIEGILSRLPPVLTEGRRERAEEHIERVLHDSRYRGELISETPPAVICPISREEPKKPGEHTQEELIRFATGSRKYGEASILAALTEGHPVTLRLISQVMHDEEMRYYRQPIRLFRLHTCKGDRGIVTGIGDVLHKDLDHRLQLPSSAGKEVFKAVSVAVGMVFGCPDTSNDGPLDQPSYHHELTRPRVQGQIKELAARLLIRSGVIPHAGAVYFGSRADVA